MKRAGAKSLLISFLEGQLSDSSDCQVVTRTKLPSILIRVALHFPGLQNVA